MALLPPLEWRKLPVRTFVTASISTNDALNIISDMLTGSVYYDGSTRVVGSGSAWSGSRVIAVSLTASLSSSTEAIYCYPPLLTTVSQSIIFSGRSIAPFTASATGSTPSDFMILSGSTNPVEVFTNNSIYMALVRNATASFTQWYSRYPFGSGSLSTGYIKASATLDTSFLNRSKFIIYESKEALAFMHFLPTFGRLNPETGSLTATVAGAIIDPEQSSTSSTNTEPDGRLYGLVGTSHLYSGSTSVYVIDSFGFSREAYFMSVIPSGIGVSQPNIPGLFLASTMPTLNHGTSSRAAGKSVFFNPNDRWGLNQTVNMMAVMGTGYFNYTSFISFSGGSVAVPIRMVVSGVGIPAAFSDRAFPGRNAPFIYNNNYLGRLRDISQTQRMSLGSNFRDSNGQIIGYALSLSDTGSYDTIVFHHF